MGRRGPACRSSTIRLGNRKGDATARLGLDLVVFERFCENALLLRLVGLRVCN